MVFTLSSVATDEAQAQKGSLYLFGESGFDYDSESKNLNFRVGGIDLFSLFRFGKAESFIEIFFEPEPSGEFFIDLERVHLGYEFSPIFILRLGRFHTPFGYFTRKYHHGLYAMTSIFRPTIIQFEDFGGPLPIHSIGVEVEGEADISDTRIGYIIDFGSGNLQVGANNVIDFDKRKTAVGKVYVKPSMFSEIGVSVGYDPFRFPSGGTLVKNLILGTDLVYDKTLGLEIIAEGYLLRELEGRKWGYGGFALFSYPVLKGEAVYEVRPYLMVDFLGWEGGNMWFEKLEEKVKLRRHTGLAAGVRIGITPETAAKIEFGYLIPGKGGSGEVHNIWSIRASVGFGLPLFLY